MFLGYGALARLDAEKTIIGKLEVPASGKQIKLPTKLPSSSTASTEGYCSAS